MSAVLAVAATAASALPGTFSIEQIYSSADGTVQFVTIFDRGSNDCDAGEASWAGLTLVSAGPNRTLTYTFPHDLPTCRTSRRNMLIATEGFAALGLVTPDYVIPNGFVQIPSGTLSFADISSVSYVALPSDGVHALRANGTIVQNVATNLAGARASVVPGALVQSVNYTALWWNSAESGWGVNFNHQGNILFGTLFTYDANGAPLWLVMSAGALQSDGVTFTGDLYRTTGPAFNANPFTPIGASNLTKVGTMSVAFTATGTATLTYTVNGVAVTKSIQKQVYGTRAANCATTTGSRAAATNYQDLWWNAAESGWGVNVTHQDQILFATLFTYDATGRDLWLVMSSGVRQADGSYLGDLYRTKGPAFNANPFMPIGAGDLTNVGTMRFRFTDGDNGTLTYTYQGVTVTKAITRQVFSSPVPSCS